MASISKALAEAAVVAYSKAAAAVVVVEPWPLQLGESRVVAKNRLATHYSTPC